MKFTKYFIFLFFFLSVNAHIIPIRIQQYNFDALRPDSYRDYAECLSALYHCKRSNSTASFGTHIGITDDDEEVDEKTTSCERRQRPKIAPPGTVKLNDTLYIQPNPVSNKEYRKFLAFMEISYSKEVRDSLDNLPLYGVNYEDFQKYMRLAGNDDELLGRMKIRLDLPLSWKMDMNEYFNSSPYRTNPVIYIRVDQTQEYCKWMTRMTMYLYAHLSKNERQRKKFYTRVEYRLPSPEEWDLVFETFSENIITNKSILPYNPALTYPAVQPKRRLMFYYLPENVSEITSADSIAIGLSWQNRDTTASLNNRVRYYRPSDWISFRCICQILEY